MKENRINPEKNIEAIVLISIIFAVSCIADSYLNNSSLSKPLIISTVISSLITYWGIPKLKALKLRQIVRAEGPKDHYSKAGTPSMGGLLILPIGIIVGNLAINKVIYHPKLIALSSLTLIFMIIGMLDDWKSFEQGTNKGLTANQKIILQSIAGALFLVLASYQNWINSKIYLVNEISFDVGLLIWPIALFVILAESNATNLTDGLDGLASGCGALIFTGIALQIHLRNEPSNFHIAGFCMAMAGSWLGFLIHNRHPAKLFMGDTGSLAMGAALSGVALLSNSLWCLFIMGGVLFTESISVILQVWIFKLSKKIKGKGKRIFKMAPIHHHFELIGRSERTIVRGFWVTTLGLVLIGLLLRPTT